MSRRPHKKSRNGCADCKRRHIRCDETRPACSNCTRAEIRCSFMSPDEPLIVPVTFNAPNDGTGQSNSRQASSSHLPLTPGSSSSHQAENNHIHDEFTVNMTHMRLLDNFHSMAFLEMQTLGKGDIPPSHFYKRALTTPYIMHACLASSAMHLATQDKEHAAFWRDYTNGLQHQAITLFNKAHPVLDVNADNCETMFLWSALVGVHVLGDAILFERGSLQAFMERFTTGLKLYRGILTIIDSCKELLFETETGAYLKISGAQLKSTTSRDGPECEDIKRMLEDAQIDRPAQQQCLSAVLELQRIFNAHKAIGADTAVVPLIFAWPFFISEDFVALLQNMHPQALVLFAQYAVLLYRARHLWLLGDGGEFLIRAIYAYVDPELRECMKQPMEELGDTSMDMG